MLSNPIAKNFRSNPTDSHDPVFRKVSWTPAAGGGSNFETHSLDLSARTIRVKTTGALKVFGYLFILVGFLPGLVIGVPLFSQGNIGVGIFALAISGIFVLAGFGFAHGGTKKLLIFDRVSGRYFNEEHRDHLSSPPDRAEGGSLSDIHALQILPEHVSGSRSSFTSYELNLVFRDGGRVTVMDHGRLKGIRRAAWTLGRFLKVPVWEAPGLSKERRTTARNSVFAFAMLILLFFSFGGMGLIVLSPDDGQRCRRHITMPLKATIWK